MIKFIWWNTSLSHKGKQNCSEEDCITACKIINFLLNNFYADVLVLTEVSESSVNLIKNNCDLKGYSVESEVTKSGKAWFDFCIIYKNSTIDIVSKQKVTSSFLNETSKVGVHFELLINKNSIINLIASHWPSNLLSNSEIKRNLNAIELKNLINEINNNNKKTSKKRANIILMGDYNEEPFSKNLTEHFPTTRDKFLLFENEELFFNPFWSELSRKDNNKNIGTYYYKSGKLNKWHTFDQMIYSSSLINKIEFEYVDIGCNIVSDNVILEAIFNNKSKIDHLPIIGIIREINNGE